MNYYHGTNIKFDKFDPTKSKTGYPVIYLTPHIEYARNHALRMEGDEKYVYTVKVKNDTIDRPYNELMQNVSIYNGDMIEIIEITKL